MNFTKKHIYVIMVVAVVLSFLSFVLLQLQSKLLKLQSGTIGECVFPNFADYKIKTITIFGPSGKTITLRKSKIHEWVVSNYFDYPADPQKINTFLQELSSMKVVQNVYVDESELPILKLLPPESNDKNSGIKITILDDKHNAIFSTIVGVKRTDTVGDTQITRGRYLYQLSTKRIVLVEDPLDEVNYKSRMWLNEKFVNIKNIKTVKLLKNGNEQWTITRANLDSKFVPTGKMDDDDYNSENIDKIISSLESLKFETVANPLLTDVVTGLNNPYVVKVDSFDNQTWQVYIGTQTKNARYVKVKDSCTSDKEWIYLVDQNRIAPMIQTSKELLRKDKKTSGPTNKIYSSPIS